MARMAALLLATTVLYLLHSNGVGAKPAAPPPSVDVGKPGGAGHALQFSDHVLAIMNPKGLPADQLTFEAWISTADYCHQGTIMSYSIKPPANADDNTRIAAANHFTIFDTKNLIGCHDIAFFQNTLNPETIAASCYGMYKPQTTVSVVDREAAWHHLAVTWDGKNNGIMRIYLDGSLMATAVTNKTSPVQAGGLLALGQEQDCFGGCFQTSQAYYGLMDEVRIWRTTRSQQDISSNMRKTTLSDRDKKDLVAWWKFDDPVTHPNTAAEFVNDWSGRQNHLPLGAIPSMNVASIKGRGGRSIQANSVKLHGNYLVKKKANMPNNSFTIEFWARGDTPDAVPGGQYLPAHHTILSYAAKIIRTDSSGDAREGVFADDAIRISRVFTEHVGVDLMPGMVSSTHGSLSLHVNSNPHEEAGNNFETWIDFDTKWTDSAWHHVALTWDFSSGQAHCYFDGQEAEAYWMQDGSTMAVKGAPNFAPRIAAQMARGQQGALFLGVDQNCYGSCLVAEESYSGEIAMLRIWDQVRDQKAIQDGMYDEMVKGPVSAFLFKPQDTIKSKDAQFVKDHGTGGNNLQLRVLAPKYEFSTAPLLKDGKAVQQPTPGTSGYALQLSDKQVVMKSDFKQFPTDAITVEFWARSTDQCRSGAPFSYATGEYGAGDNSFLIFNYNNLGIAVMEKEGLNGESMHTSGVSITDGAWHYVAVTWESMTGLAKLYLDGRLVWVVTRAKGNMITPGGTLVLGREQDCMGGCFDSMEGAAGKTSPVENANIEYGPQDFTGAMENLRIWKSAKSAEDLWSNYVADIKSFTGSGPGVGVRHQDLVAFYKFDEGGGFLVKDIIYGNHLSILKDSKWEVMNWQVQCGNGILEKGEECDDGDVDSGNGCSSECKVEKGWSCVEPDMGQPSYCTTGSGSHSRSGGGSPSHPSSGGNPTSSHRGGIAAGIIFALLIIGLFVAAYIKREWVFDNFPPAEHAANWVSRRLGLRNPRAYDHIDPEELDLPEFIEPSAARTVGAPGSYMPMPDGPK